MVHVFSLLDQIAMAEAQAREQLRDDAETQAKSAFEMDGAVGATADHLLTSLMEFFDVAESRNLRTRRSSRVAHHWFIVDWWLVRRDPPEYGCVPCGWYDTIDRCSERQVRVPSDFITLYAGRKVLCEAMGVGKPTLLSPEVARRLAAARPQARIHSHELVKLFL